ncbi:hypothetical protein MCOR27_001365 [Pyricularia oryzae]|uniref:Uncharacterized protein n=1 Tax=Pyricularia grisea TaxID=148305 RepID=A0ABQ8NNK8_PYRGI|nr:hypothetical protein MCOR02_008242 [Pyricularia oryzae]KAI6299822.1 hypothetical protein MCOR33_004314 [Pyricularia grisea]KAI6254017.1 hypothetical protein MCOR19_009454 [Pyricularia oryzae]KAI6287464.1 hypothetical protein MCOR27_001365 [Pyricularia oryzae]KAI6296664.1 hypothetical protein MCOR34_009439 [Pyricularia oryzae]
MVIPFHPLRPLCDSGFGSLYSDPFLLHEPSPARLLSRKTAKRCIPTSSLDWSVTWPTRLRRGYQIL